MKKNLLIVSCLLLISGAAWVAAQEDLPSAGNGTALKPQTGQAVQYSYAIGLNIGNDFRSNGTQLDTDSLLAGLRDGLQGAKPRFDKQTCTTAMQQLQMEMQRKAVASSQVAGKKNKQLGADFLAKNRSRDGIKVTKSGLQYKVLKSGDGPVPGPHDTVRCNYRGTLIDGTLFDASARHGGPVEFRVGGVIPGWTEALQMMHAGDKWQLFIPAELAYNDNPPTPDIEPGSVLLFDIELLEIVR